MRTGQLYIAFLRAVNVGGRKVEMARLREVLTGLGLGAVRTYIASGNAIFTSPETDRARLVDRIGTGLAEAFAFAIPAVLRTVPELKAELAASPFVGRQPAAGERFSMIFTSGSLADGEFPMRSASGDWEVLGASGSTAFARYRPRGGPLAGNPNPLIEKTFGVQATGRFFHTAQKILAAAEQTEPPG